MSKRFGRNQRRRLQISVEVARRVTQEALADMRKAIASEQAVRAQFSETQRAIAAILGSEFRLADGEEVWMIPEGKVRRYTDTTDYARADKMYEVERTASVVLVQFKMTERLMEALSDRFRNRELVSFRGIRWAIDNLEANRPEQSHMAAMFGAEYTVHLRAIGMRRA